MLLQINETLSTAERISQLSVTGILAVAVVVLAGVCIFLYKKNEALQSAALANMTSKTEQMITVAVESKNAFENLLKTNEEILDIVRDLKYKQ